MSIYNMVYWENRDADFILSMLWKKREDFGRYRDCEVENWKIFISTRNGWWNRECWEDDEDWCDCVGCRMRNVIPKYEWYLYDEDDDFDSTYATIVFEMPKKYKDLLSKDN